MFETGPMFETGRATHGRRAHTGPGAYVHDILILGDVNTS